MSGLSHLPQLRPGAVPRPHSPIEAMIDKATGADQHYTAPAPRPPPSPEIQDARVAAILEVVDAAQAWKRDRQRGAKRAPAEGRLIEAVRAWERLGG